MSFFLTSGAIGKVYKPLISVCKLCIVFVFSHWVAVHGAGHVTEYSILAPLASKSLLLDVAAPDGHLVVVGERGHILVADRPQGPWKQSRAPTRVTLTAVYFHDRLLGWAVGHDAVILRTVDGGKNWRQVHAAPEKEAPLLDVWFKDDQYGIAVGAYGLYMTSSDSGLHWSRRELNLLAEPTESPLGEHSSQEHEILDVYDVHLNAITQAPGGSLFIAAEAGRLYRSDDDGLSWVSLNSPYRGSFFGILPLSHERLMAYGLRGNVFLTEDGGMDWQRVLTPTRKLLTDGLRTADGKVIIVGLAGTVLLGDEQGQKFSLIQQESRKGYSAITRAESGVLVVVGEMGVETLNLSDAAHSGLQ